MEDFKVVTTKRGGKYVVIDGFRFRIHQVIGNKKQWKCVETGFPSRCHTDVNVEHIFFLQSLVLRLF